MLRSSHDACGCSTQTTSTINLKRSTLHPHEGQADRPNTPSDSVNHGSNPGPSTDPTTRMQEAGFQESGFSPKISLNDPAAYSKHISGIRAMAAMRSGWGAC